MLRVLSSNEKIDKYLDELAEEYKDLLLKALLSRSKVGIDDLSTSELLRLDAEIKKPLFEEYRIQRKRQRVLLVAGLTYMLVALIALVMAELIDRGGYSNPNNIFFVIGITMGFLGITISASAVVSHKAEKPNKPSDKEELPKNTLVTLKYQVIIKWREVEGLVNDMSADDSIKTPRSAINFLSSSHIITKVEAEKLKKFLKTRNAIIHSPEETYTAEELSAKLKQIDSVVDKIRSSTIPPIRKN